MQCDFEGNKMFVTVGKTPLVEECEGAVCGGCVCAYVCVYVIHNRRGCSEIRLIIMTRVNNFEMKLLVAGCS